MPSEHGGATWREFWGALDEVGVPCRCEDPNCGVMLQRCGECRASRLGVKVFRAAPRLAVFCLDCGAMQGAWRLVPGEADA